MKPILFKLLRIYLILFALPTYAQQVELKFQKGHTDKINQLSFTPDGKTLASCSDDKTIKIWDVQTGKELRSLNGHKSPVKSITIDTDGQKLYSSGNKKEKKIFIWNLNTGQKLSEQKISEGEIVKIEQLDKNGRFAVLEKLESFRTKVTIWENNFTTQLHELKIPNDFFVKDISANTYNNKIVLVGKYLKKAKNKSIWVFDTNTGKKTEILTNTGTDLVNVSHAKRGEKMISVGDNIQIWDYSPAGYQLKETIETNAKKAAYLNRDVILFSKAKDLVRYNITKQRAEGNISQAHSKTIQSLDLTYNKKYVITAADDNEIKLWDVNSLSYIPHFANMKTDLIRSIAVSKKENVLYNVTNSEKIQVWDFSKAKHSSISPTLQRRNSKPTGVSTINNGAQLVITASENKGVEIWDTENKRSKMILPHSAFVRQAVAVPNSSKVAGVGRDRKVLIWDTSTPEAKPTALSGHRATINAIAADISGNFLYTGGLDKNLKIWNLQTNSVAHTIAVGMEINTIDVSDDASLIAVGCGSIKNVSSDKSPNALYIYKKELADQYANKQQAPLQLVGHSAPINSVQFVKGEQQLLSASMDNTVIVWDATTGKIIRKIESHSSDVNAVTAYPEKKLIISGGDDANVRLTDNSTGNTVLSFVSFGDGQEYIAYDNNNYYSCSKKGAQNVHFVTDNKVYLFDQFDLRLNRPDIVFQHMPGISPALLKAYHQAYKKRLRKMKFTEDMFTTDFNIPTVQLANEAALPYQMEERNITLNVHASDPKSNLDRINIWINDVPIFGKNGINLRKEQTKEITKAISIELSQGVNKIQISALNQQGAESYKLNKFVHYNGKNERPNLYVIGIGVSKFNASEFNLDYAAKDAQDIVNKFKANSGNFGNVYTKLIQNEEATAQNILSVKDFLKQSKIDDKVIVFIASHGLLDASLDYYLATTDIDFYRPSNGGLLYDDLESLLDGIPARNKLLMIDACHSGEVDEEEMKTQTAVTTAQPLSASGSNETSGVKARGFKRLRKGSTVGLEGTFELMKSLFVDLRKGSGANVISAAGGKEYALENAEWSNGIFTFSVLDALTNNKADKDHNNQIDITELQEYVSKMVIKLTQGQQHPTFRKENLDNNFIVW